jgi:hypothetical protein
VCNLPTLINLHRDSYQIALRSSRCWLVNLRVRRNASRQELQSSGCAFTSLGTFQRSGQLGYIRPLAGEPCCIWSCELQYHGRCCGRNVFVWARNKHVLSEWTLFLALQLPSLNANRKIQCNHSYLKREDGDLLADWCQIYVTAEPAAVWICVVAPEGLWPDRQDSVMIKNNRKEM